MASLRSEIDAAIANLGPLGFSARDIDIQIARALATLADQYSGSNDIVLAAGKAIKTDAADGDTALIQVHDTDGNTYRTFVTLTNGNTPSMAIAAPSGGSLTVAADADGLTAGGIIIPQQLEIATPLVENLITDAGGPVSVFLANAAYQVIAVQEVHDTASGTSGDKLQLYKDTGTTAPGGGTALLTNNSNGGFDTNGTANTVQTGTLVSTAASKQLAAGDRLSLGYSAGSRHSLNGVMVVISLKRI